MADGTIDPKLNHLVRKCLSMNNDENRTPNADQVADSLRKKYREYQRKDITKLTRQVQTILENIEEKAQEDEYDKEARAYDEARSSSMNGLNASLTKRYRKLQQDRDAEEEANRALQAAEEGNLQENSGMDSNNDSNENGTSKKRLREGSSSSSGALEKRASKILSGGKSTKRKKRSSKSGPPDLPGKDGASNVCEPIPRPTERYKDLGGMGDILTQIRQLVEYPLVRPELYRHLGVDPPRGVLLRGPPG